jgi:hypothetical protein
VPRVSLRRGSFLRGLPIAKGPEAEVIALTHGDGDATDAPVLALLQNDPSWAWLKGAAEDVYTEEDVQSR